MPKPLRWIIIIWIVLTIIAGAIAMRRGVQPRWVAFWGFAFFVSLLHSIPGWIYGLYSLTGPFDARKGKDDEWIRTIRDKSGGPSQFWKHVYALPQALTYFVSSLAGFAALYILLNNYLSAMTDITASKAAVLIALFFFAIAGLSGALGRILIEQKGLPGIKGS